MRAFLRAWMHNFAMILATALVIVVSIAMASAAVTAAYHYGSLFGGPPAGIGAVVLLTFVGGSLLATWLQP